MVAEDSKIQRLEDRLAGYEPDVAQVIRIVLFEEQRRLGLKSPKDIMSVIESAIEGAVAEAPDSTEADA